MMKVVCLLTLLLTVVGCSNGSSDDLSTVRTMDVESGGRWIGNAICYGPHRDGQSPYGESPTTEQVREDLQLMAPRWNLMRIYSSTGAAEPILELIRSENFDMKVVVGVWIAPDAEAANQEQVDAAIRLANEYSGIVAAVGVGNETQVSWSAHRSSLDALIDYVRQVRGAIDQPVTSADDFNFWNKLESRRLAQELDFLLVHAHPLWNGKQRSEALPWLTQQLSIVQQMHPGRTLLLGETGWATSVHTEGEQARLIHGVSSAAEQELLYRELRAWADSTGQVVFWFEAFDENWKGGDHPNEVEKHWGVMTADRQPKF